MRIGSIGRRGALLGLWAALPGPRRGMAAQGGAAQPWAPERPLRLVIPYSAGGGTDLVGRAIAERLARDLGQAVVPENRPGGNTIVAAQAVLAQPADGHTLFMGGSATLVVNPLLYRRLPYDAARDFTLLAISNAVPLVVVMAPALGVATLPELVRLARERGDRMAYASNGLGNPTHLAAEMFRMAAGLSPTHVPFNGSAPSQLSVLGGHTQMLFDVVGSAMPLIREGRLRALAVTTAERLSVLPEVPTVAECGFPGYAASFWYGFSVAARTPEPAKARLGAALNAAIGEPGFRAMLEPLGLAPEPPRGPAEVQRFLAEDTARWAAVVRGQGIALE
jgi:tripartite-type tricarboxylate transporter receptor subunit TctC